jgi:hypothetical protein
MMQGGSYGISESSGIGFSLIGLANKAFCSTVSSLVLGLTPIRQTYLTLLKCSLM